MRDLRSWLFDIGFVLVIAAPAAAAYFRSSRTYEISEPEALIHASYIDIGRALAAGRPLSAVGADSAQVVTGSPPAFGTASTSSARRRFRE